MTEPRVLVRSIRGGCWHIASHIPSGYGVWTLCGRSWPESHYEQAETRSSARLCERCATIAAAGGETE